MKFNAFAFTRRGERQDIKGHMFKGGRDNQTTKAGNGFKGKQCAKQKPLPFPSVAPTRKQQAFLPKTQFPLYPLNPIPIYSSLQFQELCAYPQPTQRPQLPPSLYIYIYMHT